MSIRTDLSDLAHYFEEHPAAPLPTMLKLGGDCPRATVKVSAFEFRALYRNADGWHYTVTNDWLRALRDFGSIRVTLECPRWDTSDRPPRDRSTFIDEDEGTAA